jgi:hypothetical protein
LLDFGCTSAFGIRAAHASEQMDSSVFLPLACARGYFVTAGRAPRSAIPAAFTLLDDCCAHSSKFNTILALLGVALSTRRHTRDFRSQGCGTSLHAWDQSTDWPETCMTWTCGKQASAQTGFFTMILSGNRHR